MNSQENTIIDKERKQIRAFISCLRTENNAIGKRLASMISLVGSARASQLGIDLTITEFEKKLGAKR